MRPFLSEYKESLKAIEAEEVFDLLIYRPLAFLFVKAVYPTNLTPNQVSVIAMLLGIAAGILFGFGAYGFLIAGGIFYFVCNVLDCADGQIARLKKNGTKTGRIIDGFLDYIVSAAVFAGIAIGLTTNLSNGIHPLFIPLGAGNDALVIWCTVILAGISSAFQAFCFDFYRNKFLENVYGRFSSLDTEIKEFQQERDLVNAQGKFFDKFLIDVYLIYCRLQLKVQSKEKKQEPVLSAEEYSRKNKFLLRLWSFAGSTTHITVCVLCALINRIELYLLVCLIPLNLLIALLYLFGTKR